MKRFANLNQAIHLFKTSGHIMLRDGNTLSNSNRYLCLFTLTKVRKNTFVSILYIISVMIYYAYFDKLWKLCSDIFYYIYFDMIYYVSFKILYYVSFYLIHYVCFNMIYYVCFDMIFHVYFDIIYYVFLYWYDILCLLPLYDFVLTSHLWSLIYKNWANSKKIKF